MSSSSLKARHLPSALIRSGLSLALAFGLLVPPLPVLAAEDHEAALERAETILFGKPTPDGGIEDRIERVERRIFNKRKGGSDDERIDRITSTLLIDRKKLKVTRKDESAAKRETASELEQDKAQVEKDKAQVDQDKAQVKAADSVSSSPSDSASAVTEAAASSPSETSASSAIDQSISKIDAPVSSAKTEDHKVIEPVVTKTAAKSAESVVKKKADKKSIAGKRTSKKTASKGSPNASAAKKSDVVLTQETATLDARKAERPASHALNTPVTYPSSNSTRISRGSHTKVSHAAHLLREGMEAHRKGEDSRAEQLFKRVVLMEPRNPDGYFNLGALSEKKNDLAGALMSYRAALNLNPNDKELREAVDSVEGMLGVESAGNVHAGEISSNSETRAETNPDPERRSAEIREYYSKESAAKERTAHQNSDRFDSEPGSYGSGQKTHGGPALAPNFYRAKAKTTREIQEEAAPYADVSDPNNPVLTVSPPPTPVANTSQPFQLQTARNQAMQRANQYQPRQQSAKGAAARAILGIALQVGTSYALRQSGLHCPVCRIGGGGGALRGLLRF